MCLQLSESILVAAIGDGAGSAPLADLGAEAATSAFVEAVRSGVQEGYVSIGVLADGAIQAARNSLQAKALEHGANIRDLATTLLAVVLTPSDGVAVQIGDGVIVSREENDWTLVIAPQHGEFVNTTRFLTDDDYTSAIVVQPLSPKTIDLVMLSDGLERLALDLPANTVFRPFFDGLLASILPVQCIGESSELSGDLEKFLGSERVSSRTDDDVSIVLATRRDHFEGQ